MARSCDKEFQMIPMFCKNLLVLSLMTSSLIMMGCQKGSNATQDASTSFSREFSSLSQNVSTSAETIQTPGDFLIPGDNVNCSFNNQEVLDGRSVTAYLNSTVAFGSTCQQETRTCTSGVLSGSSQYATCAVDAPASCLFNGETLAHNQSITTYLNSNVAFGESCVQEVRTCSNGALSGSSQYATCAVAAPASCLFNGQTVAHGQNAIAFAASTVAFGATCQQETRTCSNGALSGSSQYATCAVAAPASCLFNGQTIAHGQDVLSFATSTVAFGESCQQETRTCANGTLSGSSKYASCEVDAPASCLFNGQTIAHGQNVMGYLAPSVDSESTCKQETRTCANGSLSGSYFFPSCVVEQQAPTPLPIVTDPVISEPTTPSVSSTPVVSETTTPSEPPVTPTPSTSSTPVVSEPVTPIPADEAPTTPPVTPTPSTSSTPVVSEPTVPTTPPVVTPTPSTSSTPVVSQPTTPTTPDNDGDDDDDGGVTAPTDPNECPTYKKDHFDCRNCKPGQHDCRRCMKDHKESTSKDKYNKKHKDCKKPKKEKKDKEDKKDDCKDKDKHKDKKDCKDKHADKKKDCDESKKEKKAHEHKHHNKPCDHEHKHQKDRPCNLEH